MSTQSTLLSNIKQYISFDKLIYLRKYGIECQRLRKISAHFCNLDTLINKKALSVGFFNVLTIFLGCQVVTSRFLAVTFREITLYVLNNHITILALLKFICHLLVIKLEACGYTFF